MEDSVLFDDLSSSKPPSASFYDDMFDSYFNRAAEASEPSPKASSSPSTPTPPVFDKPVFDDDPDTVDPFDAIPLFGGGGGGEGEDFLGGAGSAAKPERRESDAVGFDEDLLPGLGGSTNSTEEPVREVEPNRQPVGFDDDLVPGFDGSMKPAPQMEPETVAFDDVVIPDFGGGTSHPHSARSESLLIQNFHFACVYLCICCVLDLLFRR